MQKVLVGIVSAISVAVGSAVTLKALSMPTRVTALENNQASYTTRQDRFEAAVEKRFDEHGRKLDTILRRLPRGRE